MVSGAMIWEILFADCLEAVVLVPGCLYAYCVVWWLYCLVCIDR